MRAEKPPLPSFLRVLRPVLLLGGTIYFTFFAVAGSQVVRLGSLVWHLDALLPFEVAFWVVLATAMLIMAAQEIESL